MRALESKQLENLLAGDLPVGETEETPVILDEEQRLLQNAQMGDRQAFAQLVERYWDRLYRWLFHLTHDRHSAEDLAQEAFLRAFAHIRSFKLGGKFQAWLFRIAYNNLINQWRSPERIRQTLPPNLATPDEGPLEHALTRERMQVLLRAVGRLPADFRAAFLLRVEADLSFREIAEVLGVQEETARWRVFKARQKLMKVLNPQREREEV
jgi:RNA polymerase sigma-70 factor (ECF subfamily)